ncbi:hypothetical protein [Phytohabitans suffuscus]|uniref:Uncharacterized protein n=1 Tax=Phytohabitans suffuscus TaxID=624315 RepID=A0A6F8YI76_9ACTN|nr:hypothetical protein [Phytohabitans suffuscus]BCB85786.1 hypothetical protein Psuf_030990 [Phytohabitans suffuscus]
MTGGEDVTGGEEVTGGAEVGGSDGNGTPPEWWPEETGMPAGGVVVIGGPLCTGVGGSTCADAPARFQTPGGRLSLPSTHACGSGTPPKPGPL